VKALMISKLIDGQTHSFVGRNDHSTASKQHKQLKYINNFSGAILAKIDCNSAFIYF